MRGFFGILGPELKLNAIINRYETYRLTLDDTHFLDTSQNVNIWNPSSVKQSSQNVNKNSGNDAKKAQNVIYLSQWLHRGTHLDPNPRQLFDHLKVVGWASLYEKEELKSKLEINGDFTSIELIQHAWDTWGVEALKHLEGDFSFVVWDQRSEKLFLVKDQIGIRPLFYAIIDGCPVFGTTVPVLKAAFHSSPEINRLYVAHELKNYPVPVDITFFKDIKRLKPAHYVRVEGGSQYLKSGEQPTELRYWDLEPIELNNHTNEELIEMVREEMTKAIKRRIVGIDKVGCQLSGGLDSSVIGVILSRIMDKQKLHTYSFVLSDKTRPYSERGIDEQWSQDMVREFAGLLPENHHHITEFHYRDVYEEIETSQRVLGGLANSDTIWQDTLFKTAAEHGVQVIFSGFPGDEGISTGGGNYYYDFVKYRQWGGIFSHLMHFHIRGLKHFYSFWKYGKLGTTKPDYPNIQLRRNLLRDDVPENSMIRDTSFRFNPGFKSGFKEKILRFHTTLRTESEGTYANQYGIETRYPLVDIRLIQLVYSLPAELFRPKPYTRALFRNVCKGLLPEKVRLQPKFTGAMTLAFAEYWKKKTDEQLKSYELKDPLKMYISQEEFDAKLKSFDNKLESIGQYTKLKKIDALISMNC